MESEICIRVPIYASKAEQSFCEVFNNTLLEVLDKTKRRNFTEAEALICCGKMRRQTIIWACHCKTWRKQMCNSREPRNKNNKPFFPYVTLLSHTE